MKKLTKILTGVLCAAVIGASMGAFAGCGNKSEAITVSGSSSVTPIMEKLAAEYEKTHDVRITINMSSSGAGISDTQNGLNDFGMSSRELKDSETGISGTTLCMDGIALIVNKNCAVNNVNKADVKALFENGTVIPETSITAAIGRDASSGTRTAFDELLKIESGYATSVATLAETGNVIEAIQGSNNSLGYISYGSLTSSVKAVSLDGISCTYENIISGDYSLQRPFVIVLKDGKKLSDAAQGFYDYIMSAEAQTVITSNGYISVK
ncbi:MAG: substrate-binding domain-containing protein [Corallococcus sp.]|nr:substrate-binding domain-containing protein [Corallococcus sp.]